MQPPFRSTVPLIPAPASAYRPYISSAPPGIGATAPTANTTSGALTGGASSLSAHPSMSSTASSGSSLYPAGAGSARGWPAAGEPDPKVARSQLLTGALAVTLGLLSVALLIGWLRSYRGGFSLDDSARRFNLHPLCMVLAIALLLTNGVLAWRLWPISHGVRKVLHVVMNASALALVGLGLYFVYSTLGSPHNYSMHSWLGLATALLLGLQAIGGLLYLLPAPSGSKLRALPRHAWFGLSVYTLAMLTVTTGVMNLFALLSAMNASGSGSGNDVSSHFAPLLSNKEFQNLVPNSRESVVGALLGLTLFTLLLSTLHAVMPRRRSDAITGNGGGTGSSGSSSSSMGAGSETTTMTTSPEARPIAARFPMYSR